MQNIRKNYNFGYLCSDKDISLYHWHSIKYSLAIFDVRAVITLLGSAVIPGLQMTGQGNPQSSHRNQGSRCVTIFLALCLYHLSTVMWEKEDWFQAEKFSQYVTWCVRSLVLGALSQGKLCLMISEICGQAALLQVEGKVSPTAGRK